MSNTIVLIPTTTFGGNVGNYYNTSPNFSSNSTQGDGYYGSTDGLHTVSYTTTNFLGNIQMQGTLAKTPIESDWFNIDDTLFEGNAFASAFTVSNNFSGNFVWVRANVQAFSQGTINKVQINLG